MLIILSKSEPIRKNLTKVFIKTKIVQLLKANKILLHRSRSLFFYSFMCRKIVKRINDSKLSSINFIINDPHIIYCF